MKDFFVTETLVKLMCCFVPTKRWRARIRYRLVVNPRLQYQLLKQGFTLNDGVMTTPQGVRIDVSDTADCPLYLVREVFVKSEYNLDIGRESVLIDIGMNRAAVSLRFATNENIKSVYAFEPFRPTFESAKRNLELNAQLSEKIHTFNVGLGRKETTLEVPYQSARSGCMSTTHDVLKGQENVNKETVVIKDAAKEIAAILRENKNRYGVSFRASGQACGNSHPGGFCGAEEDCIAKSQDGLHLRGKNGGKIIYRLQFRSKYSDKKN